MDFRLSWSDLVLTDPLSMQVCLFLHRNRCESGWTDKVQDKGLLHRNVIGTCPVDSNAVVVSDFFVFRVVLIFVLLSSTRHTEEERGTKMVVAISKAENSVKG